MDKYLITIHNQATSRFGAAAFKQFANNHSIIMYCTFKNEDNKGDFLALRKKTALMPMEKNADKEYHRIE